MLRKVYSILVIFFPVLLTERFEKRRVVGYQGSGKSPSAFPIRGSWRSDMNFDSRAKKPVCFSLLIFMQVFLRYSQVQMIFCPSVHTGCRRVRLKENRTRKYMLRLREIQIEWDSDWGVVRRGMPLSVVRDSQLLGAEVLILPQTANALILLLTPRGSNVALLK